MRLAITRMAFIAEVEKRAPGSRVGGVPIIRLTRKVLVQKALFVDIDFAGRPVCIRAAVEQRAEFGRRVCQKFVSHLGMERTDEHCGIV